MSDHRADGHSFLGNELYNVLKFIALILLPALGSFYYGLSDLWGLPKAEEVVGTIVLVDTFLGLLLGLSSKQYKATTPDASPTPPVVGMLGSDGVHPDTGIPNLQLTITELPDEVLSNDTVLLKIQPPRQSTTSP